MKRLMIVAVIGLAGLATQAMPNGKSFNFYPKAKATFTEQFGQVKDVTWQPCKDHATQVVKAIFKMDDEEVTAFFNADGELIATTVSLEKSQLPMRLRQALEKELNGMTIDELFHVDAPDENAYYVAVNSTDGKKVYRGYANGHLREVSKSVLK